MRRTILILLAAASPLVAQQQQSAPDAAANAAVSSAKVVWEIGHNYVLRSAEQVPESLYAFRPAGAADHVRTFGQIVAHVADAERMFCTLATGGTPDMSAPGVEKTKTSKADVVQALKESGTFCEAAYAQADAAALATINMFGRPQTRLVALNLNGAHDMEHYGNLVTYMRIKGLTPPSSQR